METTEDKLLGGKVIIIQPAKGYRVAIDPVLLAACVPAEAGQSVLDLGSGTGAASFCLRARVNCRITGIENNPDHLALSRQSLEKNGWGKDVSFVEGNIQNPPPEIPMASFDWVMANPPYFNEAAYSASLTGKNAAHASAGGIAPWLECAARFLKPSGWFFLIYPAEDEDVLAELNRVFREIRILRVQPRAGEDSKRLLIAASPSGRPVIAEAGSLILHEDNGDYTEPAHAILWDAKEIAII
ncbi:MAG: methyltransferase domain-containing protein [Proteobacteria bacterium]|nr:methyltransferase domain-containing protein [Pseudomonadota bacterium]